MCKSQDSRLLCESQDSNAVCRVVSSEISVGKFPEIYSNLSRNFRKFLTENFQKFILIFPEISGKLLMTYVNQLFPSPALQSDAVK